MERTMKKRMTVMLIAVGVLFGAIFLYKGVSAFLFSRYIANYEPPPVAVSTMTLTRAKWQPELKAVGSMRAVLGVNVTAQLGGMIQTIYFTPGSMVTRNAVLVQQNADPDIAQLQALKANAELARITYERDKAQFKVRAVSKQQLDTDEQNLRSLRAQVAQQAAVVEKLTIRAPFTGRLGISRVNPGQYLNPGDTVVTLQRLDPIYADFYLPQQALAELEVGQSVQLTTDTFHHQVFTGKITTINPLVDAATRNVEVEATIDNPKNLLTPGMFATVNISISKKLSHLTAPQTAISFNPYGDLAFVVKNTGKKDKKDKPILIANQKFVMTGETRGDQVAILQGLKEGDVIVTSGQLKLKNGTRVVINNKVQPSNDPNPQVSNEHEG
jgi:membrane fusion protein (multidrug efflux system)